MVNQSLPSVPGDCRCSGRVRWSEMSPLPVLLSAAGSPLILKFIHFVKVELDKQWRLQLPWSHYIRAVISYYGACIWSVHECDVVWGHMHTHQQTAVYLWVFAAGVQRLDSVTHTNPCDSFPADRCCCRRVWFRHSQSPDDIGFFPSHDRINPLSFQGLWLPCCVLCWASE